MADRDDYFFTFDGADHPDGPWNLLRVVELRGEEAISRPFWFELDLVTGADDVSVRDLVGRDAAIKIRTDTEPAFRIIHGLITGAVELPVRDITAPARYRVTLSPPCHRVTLMRRSSVFLDKTLREIVEQVLQREGLGAGLSPSHTARPLVAREDLVSFHKPRLTFAWALEDTRRIDDPDAHPYCVQYDESDHDFVARLLEENGISYHYEHADDECCLVLTDFDGGRPVAPLGVGEHLKSREVFAFSDGARLRPKSVFMSDYDWRNPNLDLGVESPGGVTDFTHVVAPGRYRTDAMGEVLAEKREERLDNERSYATAEGHCRALAAGQVIALEHDLDRFRGSYLITEVRHHGVQRSRVTKDDERYRQRLELLRGAPFRPPRLTARPRIYGTQTAVVTADPSDPEAEINVGGPHHLGCIRVRFHWDRDEGRHQKEPTSCWVRVSQFFAGRDHGALWHPRVGDEVVVDFIDGDPDRPIVVGRVYNGTHPAPENATQRPTYSAIKSNTSPYDGNYNLIAFEDLQGSEEIIIHAARDLNSNVLRSKSSFVGLHDKVHVVGDQEIKVDGRRDITVGTVQKIVVGDSHLVEAGALISLDAPTIGLTDTNFMLFSKSSSLISSDVVTDIHAGALAKVRAPTVTIEGSIVAIRGDLTQILGAHLQVGMTSVSINASGDVSISGASVTIDGGSIAINGGSVDVKGSAINLNC